jgi:hypothetical protein
MGPDLALNMATNDSSRRRTRRSFSLPTLPPRSLADQVIALIAPWSTHQYPGKRRALAELIGVGISTARTYMRGEAQLPAYHAEALAGHLERTAAQQVQVARLLREHARKHGERVRHLRGRALMLAQAAQREDHRPV